MNLVDRRAQPAQHAMLSLLQEPLTAVLNEARKLSMPAHHEVRAADVDLNRLGAVLAIAQEKELSDFASLLLTEKLGPRTLQSLALVAEVIHGTAIRFSDPARFSFAHGGKDGHPFPVPLKTYDQTIAVLRRSLQSAKLEDTEKADGLRRLDCFSRAIEEFASPEVGFEAALAHERTISPSLDVHTVLDDRKMDGRKMQEKKSSPDTSGSKSRQLTLF
jgi:hypothetical protein